MIYIRTDMNNTIATGHVMRCLSIADALRKQGEDTTFFLADNQAEELLRKRGYEYIVLGTAWNDMMSELPILKKIIAERKITCILIDSYQVTEEYLRQLTKLVKTVYIDDINAFRYPVSTIICYAGYWKKFNYPECYSPEQLCLGLAYVPLRKAFTGYSRKVLKDRAENLLLLSGGTDNYDVLNRILDRINREKYKKITVICGAYYPQYERLRDKYKENENIEIEKAVGNIEDYMRDADMVVTAGGTTLYELAATGTPSISYAMADNQLDNVYWFDENGLIDYAGDVRQDDVIENINSLLEKYYENKELREEKSVRLQKAVDGRGADRIANYLIDIAKTVKG